MKKIIYLFALTLMFSTLISCKKDHKVEESIIGTWEIKTYKNTPVEGDIQEGDWYPSSSNYVDYIQFTANSEYFGIYYKNNSTEELYDIEKSDIVITSNQVRPKNNDDYLSLADADSYEYSFKDGKLHMKYTVRENGGFKEIVLVKVNKDLAKDYNPK